MLSMPERESLRTARRPFVRHSTKYLLFIEDGVEVWGRTKIWEVESRRQGQRLGLIVWRNGWRQYVFEPAPGTVFSVGCLADINAFIEAHKLERNA